jgi:hypothetical protein
VLGYQRTPLRGLTGMIAGYKLRFISVCGTIKAAEKIEKADSSQAEARSE